MNLPFDSTPFDVLEVKRSQVTARRGDRVKIQIQLGKVILISSKYCFSYLMFRFSCPFMMIISFE